MDNIDSTIRKIDGYSLELAKKLISGGSLVAFPTETVYGLGANAYSDDAIKAIYDAKNRPLDNPLIVHVHKDYDITELVFDNDIAKKIREKFCPGPITLVYNSKNKVSPLVSCGLSTLAIRIPSHESAQKFLEYVDLPIAAPSANVSKHTSPVTALHVFEDFKDNVPLILDGGRCDGGIESTVVDVTGDYPVILRKGLVTAEDIKAVVGKCEYANDDSSLKARSPGMKYLHYAPKVQTVLFARDDLEYAIAFYKQTEIDGKKPVFMCEDKISQKLDGYNVLNLGASGAQMANRLYYLLHEGEKIADIIIGIELDITDEILLGVNNRFLKAFGK